MSASKKILFGIITNILLFGILEAGLRAATSKPANNKYRPVEFVANDFAFPVPGYPDCDLLWRMEAFATIPGLNEKLNSFGFRGPEFTIEKPANTRRIICIGSTGVLGKHLQNNDTFAHRLSRWLSTGKKYHWEVINLGLPSSTIFQSLQVLRKEALRLKPDIIIVGGGVWHDFTPAIGFDDEESQQEMLKIEKHKSGIHARRLRIYQLICALVEKPFERKAPEYRELWGTLIQRPDGPRVSPAKFKKFLTTIAEESKRAGSKVIFLTPAATEIVKTRSPDSDVYARIVNSVGSEFADAVANTRVALEQASASAEKLFLDDLHLSPFGHALMAAEVAEKLQSLRIDGITARSPSALREPGIKLKDLQKNAIHEFGDVKPVRIPGDLVADSDPLTVSLRAPHSIEFQQVTIPPAASLDFSAFFFTRRSLDPSSPGSAATNTTLHLRFRIDITRSNGKVTTVFDQGFMQNDEALWANNPKCVADLSVFAGQTVNIKLSVEGWSLAASWGTPTITAFR
ncbi:MAG: SGNH/GDSL hydrolase family protein [Planctomycetota bacterium]